MQLTRRAFLERAGGAALAGAVGLAGCLGAGGGASADATYVTAEPDYRGWFDGVSNYRGTVDERGNDRVTVAVGSRGDLGYFKFDPPAVAVSPGTTVTWRWTGRGGPHDVVARDGSFDSGAPVDRADVTFAHAFDAPGVYRYYCTPHRGMGMRGAVFVALDEQ